MNDTSRKTLSSICQPDADHHCLTCADEAVPVQVVRIDQEAGLALCSPLLETVGTVPLEIVGTVPYACPSPGQVEEIDITLLEDVAVGDILLAHAGVAIAHQERASV